MVVRCHKVFGNIKQLSHHIELFITSVVCYFCLDAVLRFTTTPAFSPANFVKSKTTSVTTLNCNSEETDVNFPSSSTVDVQFVLPNGTLLSMGVSGNGKYTITSSYISIIRRNVASLHVGNPTALDTGNYMCIASTTPSTAVMTAIARLEVKGNFFV